MASPCENEDSTLDLKKVIKELMIGKEFAVQVERQLKEDTEIAALMGAVVGVISRALSYLDRNCDDKLCIKNSSLLGNRSRNTYKKGIPPSSLRRERSKTINDGYIWRKYGKKEIQGVMHPRSYYRCFHKNDLGCQARRQVQKSEEDPSLFLITYIGEHSCKEPAAIIAHQQINTFSSLKEQYSLISFASSAYNNTTTQDHAHFPSSNLTHGSSSSGDILTQNLGVGTPICDLDMSFMVDSLDNYNCIDDQLVFGFDDSEFLYFIDGHDQGAPVF